MELEWEYQFRELGSRILNEKKWDYETAQKLNPGMEYLEQRIFHKIIWNFGITIECLCILWVELLVLA